MGEAYEHVRAPNEAVRSYRKAVAIDPQFVIAHFALARLLEARGDLAGVEAALRSVVAAQPKYDRAHHQLGRVLVAQKKTTEAAAEFRRAVDHLELLTDYDRYYDDLTLDLLSLGQARDALRLTTRLMELRPDWAANLQYPLRYNAACCAAVLSTDAKVPPDERARLRRQAQMWLAGRPGRLAGATAKRPAPLPAGGAPAAGRVSKGHRPSFRPRPISSRGAARR